MACATPTGSYTPRPVTSSRQRTPTHTTATRHVTVPAIYVHMMIRDVGRGVERRRTTESERAAILLRIPFIRIRTPSARSHRSQHATLQHALVGLLPAAWLPESCRILGRRPLAATTADQQHLPDEWSLSVVRSSGVKNWYQWAAAGPIAMVWAHRVDTHASSAHQMPLCEVHPRKSTSKITP